MSDKYFVIQQVDSKAYAVFTYNYEKMIYEAEWTWDIEDATLVHQHVANAARRTGEARSCEVCQIVPYGDNHSTAVDDYDRAMKGI